MFWREHQGTAGNLFDREIMNMTYRHKETFQLKLRTNIGFY